MFESLALDCGGKISLQERKVLGLALEGKTDKQIALHLRISPGTVRTYWERMRVKLECVNRIHVAGKVLLYVLAAQVGQP